MPRNGTYWRAGEAFDATCPTCGERLIFLRWGHEERCSRFYDADLKRTVRWGLVLLVLSILAFALPARAQGVGDASAVADGLVKSPLAWMVLGLAATCVFLAKALITSYETRIKEQGAAHDQTLSTLTAVITLNLKQNEAIEVLDKALDRFVPPHQEG